MAEYITKASITNSLFQRIEDEGIKDVYVLKANRECENLANKLGLQPADISVPVAVTIEDYLVNYALYSFANDFIGVNQSDVSEGDIYKNLFDRSIYLMNKIKPEINKQLFIGTASSMGDRAVSWGRLERR